MLFSSSLRSAMRTAFWGSAAWFCLLGILPANLHAETGSEGWLRYRRIDVPRQKLEKGLPPAVVIVGTGEVLRSAQHEMVRGLSAMLGRQLREGRYVPEEDGGVFLLGKLADVQKIFPQIAGHAPLAREGFWLTTVADNGHKSWIIAGGGDVGVLYGAFAFLSKISRQEDLSAIDETQTPGAALRWVNQWDNLDGSIERGYAGPSIFFENGAVRADLRRAAEYARLLASVGINGCVINNVNANPRLLKDDALPDLARIAAVFRPWGVRLAISVDVSSPKTVGGLDTYDPLDPRVAAWWKDRAAQIYQHIPDFGGFLVKADSEGRSGPSAYQRTHADAANVLARALKPHRGWLFYRAFVYNHHLDWNDPKADRAKAAYDNFHPLDGKFDDNVIIQIKHGPIDFQAREPVSPLLGGLEHTNVAIELQITQEYTGQQRHLCFLAPMWKEVLDFDLHAATGSTPVREIVAGRTFHRPVGGYAGVANVGMDANWLGHPLAMANLYAFGRLSWDAGLSPDGIARDWTRLTFGNDPQVVQTVSGMLLRSWHIYEDYTGPLGAGTLTDITGPHFGPGIESSEGNGWGQWHRADRDGIGMDRTLASGTGFLGQYSSTVQALYEPLARCPDELLLFMHHVSYRHVLHSGKSVIQHIYDAHYEGAREAAALVQQWKQLSGRIDAPRYEELLKRLQYQAGHALVWRDAICEWFLRISGIPDKYARVGNHPHRIEAESMDLDGYAIEDVTPWETASGGRAVVCGRPNGCSASAVYKGKPGSYDIAVQYFDQNNGTARFRLLVNDRALEVWLADDHLPSAERNGHTSTRRLIPNVALKPGDVIRVEGQPDQGEPAPLDYLEILPRPE